MVESYSNRSEMIKIKGTLSKSVIGAWKVFGRFNKPDIMVEDNVLYSSSLYVCDQKKKSEYCLCHLENTNNDDSDFRMAMLEHRNSPLMFN